MAVKQYPMALHPTSPGSKLGRLVGIGMSPGFKTKTASRAIEPSLIESVRETLNDQGRPKY